MIIPLGVDQTLGDLKVSLLVLKAAEVKDRRVGSMEIGLTTELVSDALLISSKPDIIDAGHTEINFSLD